MIPTEPLPVNLSRVEQFKRKYGALHGVSTKPPKHFFPHCPICRGDLKEGAYVSHDGTHAHAKGKETGPRSFGPVCRCGARNTARIGESAVVRRCQACGQTYAYRLKDGILVPHSLETALALDGK